MAMRDSDFHTHHLSPAVQEFVAQCILKRFETYQALDPDASLDEDAYRDLLGFALGQASRMGLIDEKVRPRCVATLIADKGFHAQLQERIESEN